MSIKLNVMSIEKMGALPNIEVIKASLEAGIKELGQEFNITSQNEITTFRIGKKVEAPGDEPQIVLDIDERTGNIELLEPGTIAVMAVTESPIEAITWVAGIVEKRK